MVIYIINTTLEDKIMKINFLRAIKCFGCSTELTTRFTSIVLLNLYDTKYIHAIEKQRAIEKSNDEHCYMKWVTWSVCFHSICFYPHIMTNLYLCQGDSWLT